MFRSKDHGMPNLNHPSNRGNQYVKMMIDVPTKLSKDQKEKMQEFAKLSHMKSRSLFKDAKKSLNQ
jgi:DnaJ-class molecular chaperone